MTYEYDIKYFAGDVDDLLCPWNETQLVLGNGNKLKETTNESGNNSQPGPMDGIDNNGVQHQAEDDEVIETLKSNHEF